MIFVCAKDSADLVKRYRSIVILSVCIAKAAVT